MKENQPLVDLVLRKVHRTIVSKLYTDPHDMQISRGWNIYTYYRQNFTGSALAHMITYIKFC